MIRNLRYWLLPNNWYWKVSCTACNRSVRSFWAIRRAVFSLIHQKHEDAYWQVMGHSRGRQ